MKKIILPLLFCIASITPAASCASDEWVQLSTFYQDDSDRSYSAVTITRKADYITLDICLANDSRQSETRFDEMRKTLNSFVNEAGKNGIILLGGQGIIDGNHTEFITFDGENDSAAFSFYIAVSYSADKSADACISHLVDLARTLKGEGRTLITVGKPGLCIKNPERYRMELIREVSTDTEKIRAMFGKDARITLSGFDTKMNIRAVGSDEASLSIYYSLTVTTQTDEDSK
jgi:hypothetical protein